MIRPPKFTQLQVSPEYANDDDDDSSVGLGGDGADPEEAPEGQEDELSPEEFEVLQNRVWQWLHESPHPSEMVQIGQIGLRR